MPVSRADLEIYQGDDYAAAVTVTQEDGTTAVNLTGYTARAQIRKDAADRSSGIVCEMTAVVADVAAGAISLSIANAVTKTLSGKYVWDLQIVSSAGIVTTVLNGAVTITNEVTRQAAAG